MSIASIFRSVFRVKKMNSLAELCAYIKKGDLQHLADWIDWRIDYKKDTKPEDEWQHPDVLIKTEQGDCEEIGSTETCVIKSWGGKWASDVLVIMNSSPGKNHACCAWWNGTKELGIMDHGTLLRFPYGTGMSEIVKDRWPTAKSYYFSTIHDEPISDMVYL